MSLDPATNDRSGARFDAMTASLERVPLARLPNRAWLEFISGPLGPDDWALIGRVERGEMSVDQAMALREPQQNAAWEKNPCSDLYARAPTTPT